MSNKISYPVECLLCGHLTTITVPDDDNVLERLELEGWSELMEIEDGGEEDEREAEGGFFIVGRCPDCSGKREVED